MNEILAMVRERVEREVLRPGPVSVWKLMEHALATGQTLTLNAAQMREAVADSGYLILAKNDLVSENHRLREQLAAEELRRT